MRAATAASVVITSGTATGDDRRSDSQSESMPLCSRKSQSVHKKSRAVASRLPRPRHDADAILDVHRGDRTRADLAPVKARAEGLTAIGRFHRMNRGSALTMRDPDKPRQIVDAAVRVFARKGYWSSRVSDIAREAGIAAGTIYLYFETKEDILITVFREKMAEFVSALWAAIAQEPDAVAKLRRLVHMHFEILEREPELAAVVQVELRQGQKFFRGPATHEIAAYFTLISSVLEEGVASGRFRRDLPIKVATKMLFGAMDQMATSWVLGKRGYRLVATAADRGRPVLAGHRRQPIGDRAMPYETLILSREESFAVITLNRPPANAISVDLMRELNAALSDVENDPAVRSVIITGAGDRIFCAGADLGNAFSGPDVASFIRFGNSVVRRIERFPKPVVAAINGHALGGGCEIAMGCHIRILKETARMGQTESNLGITPGYGGTQRFPRLVGRGVALEHLILGTQIPAAECYRTGSSIACRRRARR